MLRNSILLTLVFLTASIARAQVETFDSIILDNGTSNPFVRMDSPNGEEQFIVGFSDEMGFFVNDNYKFFIESSAAAFALTLDDDGVKAKKQVNVEFTAGVFRQFEADLANGQSFAVTSFPSNLIANGGGIGFSTDSNQEPFMVFDTAKRETVGIREEGVGVGTFDAMEPLHVYSDGTVFPKAKVLVENNHPGNPVPRNMFALVNNGGSRFSFTDTSINNSWVFATVPNGSFSISRDGTGGSEFLIQPNGRVLIEPGGLANFELKSNGNLTIAGTLTQSSDKALKTAFVGVDNADVLQRVADMPVSTWQFRFDDPSLRHMGPTAQDFRAAFGLGQDDKTIAPVDGIGVSLAAIKALKEDADSKEQLIDDFKRTIAKQNRQLSEQAKKIDEQEKLLKTFAKRLEDIESLIANSSGS